MAGENALCFRGCALSRSVAFGTFEADGHLQCPAKIPPASHGKFSPVKRRGTNQKQE